MSYDLSLSTVDFDEFDRYNDVSSPLKPPTEPNFAERIFVPVVDYPAITRTAIWQTGNSEVAVRTEKAAKIHNEESLQVMGAQASGELKLKAKWGGSEGPKISVSASGQIKDQKGNFAQGKVKQVIGGEGSTDLSAGYEKKWK